MEPDRGEGRAADRLSMAQKAVGGLDYLSQRRPLEPEDLSRTLAGFLVARYFKVQRTGGFDSSGASPAEAARASAWQAYLEDAEGGQELLPPLKQIGVLAEFAASVGAFFEALKGSSRVDQSAAAALRETLESDYPAALPALLSDLSKALGQMP